ncbi:MAG: ASKHA domain-containing protein [Candidatus Thermoplasmatota archaeon]|nr:ASKHA domain-containing protein [Candidatus Thermoplasmatota archaeon]
MQKKYTALLQPWNKKVEVAEGENVLKLLTAQKLYIDSVCGGIGKCGKCKVQVKGKYRTEKTELLTKEELAEGYCLACQTQIEGHVEIFIPPSSRLGEPQILTKSEIIKVEKIAPVVDKYWLKLPLPTLTDNISDLERLQRALKYQDVSIDLNVLRKFGRILRESNWDVTVTLTELDGKHEITNIEAGNTISRKYGLAIDIGTTTVVATLVDLNEGNIIDTASDYNKQIICGADVISRINYSEEEKHGLKKLNSLVIATINYLIKDLTANNNIRRDEISYIVTAGNTTMTHLLLNISPSTIKREPYIPTANLIKELKARELGIQAPNAYLYCVPGRSAYVGGDITADILASGMHKKEELSMLIDVGTNGEVVLGSKDWLVACSCSAGPAFEGGEVDYGTRAVKGAIEKLHITPNFEVEYSVIGNVKPIGICGSGLIDLLGELFRCNIIDKSGRIRDLDNPRIREGKEGKEFVAVRAEDTKIGKDLVISESDIRNIIRTKAAIYAATSLLLKTVGYETKDLYQIFIAGAFGNYLDARKSILTGILPDVDIEKLKFIGNGALTGAQLILLSKKKKEEAEEIFRKITYIDLSTNPKFFEEFTSALFLPHTNLELFPTVKKMLV